MLDQINMRRLFCKLMLSDNNVFNESGRYVKPRSIDAALRKFLQTLLS